LSHARRWFILAQAGGETDHVLVDGIGAAGKRRGRRRRLSGRARRSPRGPEVGSLPNQVDGATIRGAAGLAQLRASRPGPIIVNGGTFARADFRRVRLGTICFVGTDLSGSDWRGTLRPASPSSAPAWKARTWPARRLPRLLLRQANLKNVDARRADLSGGKMDGGWDGSVDNLRLTAPICAASVSIVASPSAMAARSRGR
jgi:hypothetical protein